MSFINKLCVKLFSKQIGVDQFGNKYFVGNNTNYLGIQKRFVIYNGIADGSKIPPMWHAWLHYATDSTPNIGVTYNWQQDYIPNLTGTKYAYSPSPSSHKKFEAYSKWIPK